MTKTLVSNSYELYQLLEKNMVKDLMLIRF